MAVPSHENRPRPRFRSSVTDRLLPGVQRVVTVPAPAAGVDWGPVGPGGGRVWRLLAASVSLTTSAAAGNRRPRLQLSVAGLVVYTTPDIAFLPAGAAYTAVYAIGGSSVAANFGGGVSSAEIPPLWLPAGATIAEATGGLQAADQWTAAQLLVEEIYEAWQDVTLHHLAEEEEALAAAGLLASSVTGRG